MQYIQEIKQILAKARQKSYQAINTAMVEAYWNIGKRIVLEEQNGNQRADYGKEIISLISKELTVEFGKGFSERSIRKYRQFFLAFSETEIWPTLSAKLSWSHFQLIMSVSSKEAQKRRTHGSGHTLQQFCQKKAKLFSSTIPHAELVWGNNLK